MSPEASAHILVVDDNEQNRALALATLEEEGYRVTTASSGEEALRQFEKERPECVLLDVRMPGMDGFVVCQRLRGLPGGADTPVVFLTALRDVETFDAALRAGGDDFLTKPVRPTELLLRVQAVLKVRRLSAANREFFDVVRHQRDDLMRLQLQKEQLMAFVVHDLKNPVSTMDLHAQLLLRDRELSERSRRSAAAIRDEVRALMRMLLNLLDISKSEEGKLSPTPAQIDLPALVGEVLEVLAARAQAAGVTLAQAVEVGNIVADVDLLRRVLENLTDNALRHSPEGGTLTVSARARGASCELRVADAGPGVPPDTRERIFERFVQVESGDRLVKRSGRGLGLTFCRLAVEAHGGRIWVEDAAPGAVFCVELPNAF